MSSIATRARRVSGTTCASSSRRIQEEIASSGGARRPDIRRPHHCPGGDRQGGIGPATPGDKRDEQKLPTKRSTENPEAHQLYLKGRDLWNRRTAQTLRSAAMYLQQALDKDAGYGPAWAGLADCYSLYGFFGVSSPTVAAPRAKDAALTALRIDDTLTRSELCADTSISRVGVRAAGKSEEAIGELRKGLGLSGGESEVTGALGHAYAVSGKRGEAEKVLAQLKERSTQQYLRAVRHRGHLRGSQRQECHVRVARQGIRRSFDLADLDQSRSALRQHSERPAFRDLLRRMKLPEWAGCPDMPLTACLRLGPYASCGTGRRGARSRCAPPPVQHSVPPHVFSAIVSPTGSGPPSLSSRDDVPGRHPHVAVPGFI